MPYKKKYSKRNYKKRNPKRNYRKRNYRRKYSSMGVPSGMPKQRTAVLRYAEPITLTSPSGACARYFFKANDCYDPNSTGTGHQPISWDNWTNLYNRYVVVGSKITAYVTDNTASHSEPGLVGAYLTESSLGGSTDSSYMIEAKKGVWRAITGGQRSTTIVGSKFSARKFFNIKDVADNIDKLGAICTASPAEPAYFCLWYATQSGVNNTVNVQVVIDYIVHFSEPLDPTGS